MPAIDVGGGGDMITAEGSRREDEFVVEAGIPEGSGEEKQEVDAEGCGDANPAGAAPPTVASGEPNGSGNGTDAGTGSGGGISGGGG